MKTQLQPRPKTTTPLTTVRSGLLQRACACGKQNAAGQGECADCSQKRESQSQRSALGSSPQTALHSPGQPLDAGTRAYMEPRFGHDFSKVRIHADARAATSARSVNALAYTVGQDIVFGDGRYSPGSSAGRQLLAHELTHVVQQSGSRSAPQSNAPMSQAGDRAEREAESVSRTVLSGAPVPAITSPGQYSLQRQDGAGAGAGAPPAPPARKTIWVNVGFDSSASANEETMTKLRNSIAVEKLAFFSCCFIRNTGCDVDVKTHYDWNRVNKPAPSDGDYDSDIAADRTLKDKNLANISGPANGVKILVTESTLSQTWQGARIFPRANTGTTGILWNRALSALDTIAHESGHAAGYTGDSEGHSHSSDPDNLMSPGSKRHAGALPDANWCTQMAAIAR
jgi:hypothetical protein